MSEQTLTPEQRYFLQLREAAEKCGVSKQKYNEQVLKYGKIAGYTTKHRGFLEVAKNVTFNHLKATLKVQEQDKDTLAHRWVFEGKPELVEMFIGLIADQPVKVTRKNCISYTYKAIALVEFEPYYP